MPARLSADREPPNPGQGWTLPEFVLRPEVEIVRESDAVLLSFAHWELRLPTSAVAADPEVAAILRERRAKASPGSGFAGRLMALLEAQGCLLRTGEDRMTLQRVFELVQPIRSQLYASYYAHPLWSVLSRGEASLGQLAAWVTHNYHVSRSAGVIAARMATRFRNHPLGHRFRQDALDEFWHCDQFYFVRHPRLALDVEACKRYVALPGSLAFEDLALRAAGEDWLGHLLIAYFQESSIVFRAESEAFYDSVERNYGLDGFFSGWRRHMSLDASQGHAEGLEALFRADIEVRREGFSVALARLQLAHHFLLAALDQALASEGDAERAIADRQPHRLIASQESKDPVRLDPETAQILIQALREGSFEALAHARTHDEIMAMGRLAAAFERVPPCARGGMNPWLEAARNFILERSSSGLTLSGLTSYAARLAGISNLCPAVLQEAAQVVGHPVLDDGLRLACAQLQEFLELAAGAQLLRPLAFDSAGVGEA